MLKVFEAFAGYGSQRMALRNLGIEHEVVAISEFDKYADASYQAIHGETWNMGDITKIDVDDVPDHDLFTYSFPCQDISVAGKGKGFSKDSGTRSGLLWESERIIKAKKPKYLLMENVKNLTSEKFMPGFVEWILALEELGYSNYYEALNAKDFGTPQNRERVFMVSILGGHEPYVFPKPIKLEKRLKDVLEDEVDEKYYLDDERSQQLVATITDSNEIGYVPYKEGGKQHQSNTVYNPNLISPTLTAADYKNPKQILEPEIKQVGNTTPNPKRENPQTGRTYDTDGLAPTLNTIQGGNRQPQIIEPKVAASRGRGKNNEQQLEVNKDDTSNALTTVEKDNYVVEPNNDDVKPINPLKGKTNNGWHFEQEVYDDKGIARALKAGGGSGNIPKTIEGIPIKNNYRIRKLAPLECWRLMGVMDEDFYKAAYKTKRIIFKEDNEEWNVRLKDVTGNQKPDDMETFVLNITNDSNEQAETSTEWTKCLKVLEKERSQNVKIVIEKLAELEHSDYATNIIKCTDSMETLTTLTEEKGPLQTVIIELDEKVSTNTARYMRITSEENLNPLRLYTTLTLLEQIIESKISISTLHKVNICGFIENMNDSEKNTENQLKSSLKTDATFTRNSASQLYKQAGNSIVVSVLEALFRNMFLEVPDEDLIGEHIPLF